ncbi:MAG: nucleotidyltransferase [Myxococcaceae bacterium]|nr:nucleotidyltransferase [Myxococcaceae bacterium]
MRANFELGERKLEDALSALTRALNDFGAPWMLIGGIAIIAQGVRRLTTDIDAVIQGDQANPETMLHALAANEIEPRIDDALAFAAENLVLLLRHGPTGVDLDLSFGWTSFEVEALQHRASLAFGRVRAPMATPEDLIVLKAMAGRPKDIDDAAALLTLHPNIRLSRIRARLDELSSLANAPEASQSLEEIVKKAGLSRARRSRKTTRPQRKR